MSTLRLTKIGVEEHWHTILKCNEKFKIESWTKRRTFKGTNGKIGIKSTHSISNWAWWHSPVIPTLGRLKQEGNWVQAHIELHARSSVKNNNNKTITLTILTLILKVYFYVYVCFSCMCVCAVHACSTLRVQKGASDSLGLELQKFVSCVWKLGTEQSPLEKHPVLLTTEVSLQPPNLFFVWISITITLNRNIEQ